MGSHSFTCHTHEPHLPFVCLLANLHTRKLISRWDSEREPFYDDIVHVLQVYLWSRKNCLILEFIRLRILIQEFFKGFFNFAREDIFPTIWLISPETVIWFSWKLYPRCMSVLGRGSSRSIWEDKRIVQVKDCYADCLTHATLYQPSQCLRSVWSTSPDIDDSFRYMYS